MTRETPPTDLMTVAAQAAQWIDRLREANAQDLEEFRVWLRPPEHLEEFLCAVAIDFAIDTLADVDSLRGTDSAGPGDSRLPAHD
jgi:ferric-dicitrate binding protein FerR (iron transport regulator)